MKEKAIAIIENSDSVTKEAIHRGFDLLEQLAAKIGVTVDYLWPFMVREHVVRWITFMLLFAVGASTTTFALKKLDMDVFGNEYKGDKKISSHIALIIMAVIAAISTIVGFVHVWQFLPGLLNPEYHALKDLMSMIK